MLVIKEVCDRRKRNMASVTFVALLVLCFQVFASSAQTSSSIEASPSLDVSPSPASMSALAEMSPSAISPSATSTHPAEPTPIATATPMPKNDTDEKFKTELTAEMVINLSSCPNETFIKEQIKKIYSKEYDLEHVAVDTVMKDGKCHMNTTLRFGHGLNSTDIVKKFEDEIKDGTLGTIKVEWKTARFDAKVEGVITGKWEPVEGECEKKCCKAIGGEMEQKRTCKSPMSKKCHNVPKTRKMKFKNCLSVCTCSGISLKFSLALLLISGVFNRFFC